MSSNEFWLNNPSILFKKDKLTKLWPNQSMNYYEKLNSITRIVILLTALGYMAGGSYTIIMVGIVTLGIIWFLYNQHDNKNDKKETIKEQFKNIKDIITPTENNPLMNTTQNEYSDNPDKVPASMINTSISDQINEQTKKQIINMDPENKDRDKLFKDLGDNLKFEQSMQPFYSNADKGLIPNDQDGYLKFLYGDLPSGKKIVEYGWNNFN